MYKYLIMKSIKDIFDNYEVIGKALLIPIILLLVLNFASTSFNSDKQMFSAVSIFFIFLSILVDIIILITVHRILILGNDSVPQWGIQKFEQREFGFFLKYLIVFIVFVSAVVLSTAFLHLFGINIMASIFLTMIITSIYLSRVSLVFPAIAVDAQMSFRESFEFTKDFKLLIFVTVIVFPVLFSLVIGSIYTFIISMLATSISSHLNLLMVLLNVVISVFLVSALSNTYMYISETLAYQNNEEDNEHDENNENDEKNEDNEENDEIDNEDEEKLTDEHIDSDSPKEKE